jgi:subtilisin family serine protease
MKDRSPSACFVAPLLAALIAGVGAGCASMPKSSGRAMQFEGRMLVCVGENEARSVEAYRSPRGADAWTFSRAGGSLRGAGQAADESRSWLIASPPHSAGRVRGHPWDLAHEALDGRGAPVYRGLVKDLLAAGGRSAPLSLEPEVYYPDERRPRSIAADKQARDYTPGGDAQSATLCDPVSIHWPKGANATWHLDDRYSELKQARDFVAARHPARDPADRVTVAVLDTGYDEDHALNPPNLDKAASLDFSDDPLHPKPGAADPYRKGILTLPGHGCACLSILAGNRTRLPDGTFEDYLGGAPDARVVCYRISDSVVHFRPAAMAMAIRRAVADGADVISLSHGGLPSRMLADAVDEAYENGTAVFAAAGDFFQFPLLELSTPKQMVFPAAYHRVVGVCGATADGRSYGRAASPWTLLTFRKWGQWMLRGSYGPDAAMDEAIAGYSPNVPWARYTRGGPGNLLDLDGAGTSAATPQVAAAAALWLQAHRNDRELADKWRSWEKTEAVYLALFDSAEKRTPEGAHTFTYYGNGLLKARRALDLGVPKNMQPRPSARTQPLWMTVLKNLVSGVEIVSASVSQAEMALHLEMVQTELAQLVHGSKPLQEQAAELAAEMRSGESPSPAKVDAFLRAVAAEKRCSRYLRSVVEKTRTALARRHGRQSCAIRIARYAADPGLARAVAEHPASRPGRLEAQTHPARTALMWLLTPR